MDVSWQQLLVVGAAVLFIGFILWKYKPTLPRDRRRGRVAAKEARDPSLIAAAIKAAREKARLATNARARSEALVEAAKSAAQSPDGVTSATGFYLRAMRADPTSCEPLRGLSALLRRERPDVVETVMWRRLSHLKWSGETAEATRCAAEELVSLYKNELKSRDRAKALVKLMGRI